MLSPDERRLAASLVGPLADFLYAPGPDFTSPIEAGVYRASLVLVPAASPPVRITSLVAPAFGTELCRVRLEMVPAGAVGAFGSFMDPERRGLVYAMPADRGAARPAPADRPGWSYGGLSLRPRFGAISRVQLLVERGQGALGGQPLSWVAHRGLVLSVNGGAQGLVLAEPDYGEAAAFAPVPGSLGPLVDNAAPVTPGATSRELLGYGDLLHSIDIWLELVDISDVG